MDEVLYSRTIREAFIHEHLFFRDAKLKEYFDKGMLNEFRARVKSKNASKTYEKFMYVFVTDSIRDIILKAVGEDPERPGLEETPRRVASMYAEMFSGLHLDPARHLSVTFPEQYDEMVLIRDIQFTSMCEHHLLPFNGVAHVAYIPDGKVTGLSKIARVVEEVSHRPQVQERMTQTIAELVSAHLKTSGVAVVISAEHSCMSIRGIRKPGSSTVTSALRGEFKTNQSTRAEFMSLIASKP